MQKLNFKPPRDPNTKSILLVLRQLAPGEGACRVGGGECTNPAAVAYEDGSGGEFHVCAEHAPEVEALGKLVAEMTQNQVQAFQSAIDEAKSRE